MGKIPVGRTIARSYKFAFGHYLTALGIVWLPVLVSAAVAYHFRDALLSQMTAQAHGDLATVFRFRRVSLLIQLVGLVMGAIISVGITKEVLGLRRGWRFFYAGFGAAELRVIVGYFAIIILFVLFTIGFVVAVAIPAAVAGVASGVAVPAKGLIAGGAGLAVLIAGFALIYVFARLTFLFLPATVAERRIGILRSWELTSGNFWRIFAIGLAIGIPFLIFAVCAAIAILGTGYIDFVMQNAHNPAAIQKYVTEHVGNLVGNPILMAVNFILAPVVYGLLISPASYAYRALMPLPAAEMAPTPSPPPAAKLAPDLPKEIAEIVDEPPPR